MEEHTPGPWTVHEHDHIEGEYWASIGHAGWGPITDIVGEEGNHTKFFQPVASLKYLVTPVIEQKANARLIAASPELLKALERSLNWLTSYPGGNAENAYNQARAAIAKAKGN